MPAIIEPPPEPRAPLAPLWKRLAWFAGIAVASTLGVAIVAYGMKALLPSY
jgi:predicted cobalt transporter CbtA